jgi:diaminopimelate epimerase
MTVAKYSGNGNDFVLMIAQEKEDRGALAQKLCHRQNGVGADGLIVLVPHKVYDFEWEFYNADGSEAAMCGNGSRVVAHYAHEKGIAQNGKTSFLTGAGVISATINGLYVVSDMVLPKIIDTEIEAYVKKWWLIDSGVPHLVCMVEDIEHFDIGEARALRKTYNCNVNICKVEGESMYVRTYERGVEDETLACGTGMVACFIRNHKEENIGSQIKVFPRSGDELYVSYEEAVYRFGGKVTKTFVAEVFI